MNVVNEGNNTNREKMPRMLSYQRLSAFLEGKISQKNYRFKVKYLKVIFCIFKEENILLSLYLTNN